jgi:hypothetical protein
MTQNIYDDSDFFQNYSQLPRSQRGLDGAPEWPALRALRLRHVEEWGPTPEQTAAEPDWARERERPAFLLIAAEKPLDGLESKPLGERAFAL